ncbi:MAG: DEAD/DEAH box helicase [Bacteroidales bacterium]
MSKFTPGDKVINVNSNLVGVVTTVHPLRRGLQTYSVKYQDSEDISIESDLEPNVNLSDPFDRMKMCLLDNFNDFSRINTTVKIRNTSNNTVSSLKASKTIFKAYQYKPLLKFLNSEKRRILIADEVGLGKTIEAGHIMLELLARKELRNALIICPKSLQIKWQKELLDKFNLSFKIYQNDKELVSDLNHHDGRVKGIVNYEKVRSRIDKDKVQKNRFIDLIENSNKKFDFVLCDEAHRLRNSQTKANAGMAKLLSKTDSVVFLTATPIMIGVENLYNLLRLLDSHKYSNKDIFENEIMVNRPFLKALTMLNSNSPLPNIAEFLDNETIQLEYKYGETIKSNDEQKLSDYFEDDELYNRIITDLKSKEDSVETRVALQFDLSSMNALNSIFSRTRKREITTDWTQSERIPKKLLVSLTEDEQILYDEVIEEYLSDDQILALIQRKRFISSSIYGCLNDEKMLDQGVDQYEEWVDSKFEVLCKILQEVVLGERKKIIVFAIFKKTLKYLAIRLKKRGFNTALIYGDVKERDSIIDDFKENPNVQILLSSEVGSEGLDLQFCDALVNYDLPWNPMVVEQRIGRIDRFGQESPVVNIYNLIIKNSIQEDIYERLLERINVFKECIGDLEAILDLDQDDEDSSRDSRLNSLSCKINNLERELYSRKLSEEQRRRKLDDITKAIETEKSNIDQIREGMTDCITNDSYFRSEIDRILRDNKYVTENELVNYVRSLMKSHLNACELDMISDGVYKFTLPASEPKLLTNFLTSYHPNDDDSEVMVKEFTNIIRNKCEIRITFNQETAYKNKGLNFVNAYHPLIMSAMTYFDKAVAVNGSVFMFSLSSDRLKLDKLDIDKGRYLMAVYSLKLNKKQSEEKQTTEMLIPVLYNLDKEELITDQGYSEHFLGLAQQYASFCNKSFDVDSELVDDMRIIMTQRISEIEREYKDEQSLRIRSELNRRIKQERLYYATRINSNREFVEELEDKLLNSFFYDELEVANARKILPMRRANLESIIAERDEKISKLKDLEITTQKQLTSLNYIIIE